MRRAILVGSVVLAGFMLAGCAGGGATPAADDSSAAAEAPVAIAEYVQGAWSCDAVQNGESYVIDVAVTESSLSFKSEAFIGELSTTYTLDSPVTATTGDGWTLSTEQVDGPTAGEPLQVTVTESSGTVWLLAVTRSDADALDGGITFDVGGPNEQIVDLSCARA